MSGQWISATVLAAVHARTKGCCEYCRIPEIGTFFSHEPDHIIAQQHGGETTLANLALACMQCNRCKGPNIASVDRETNFIVQLFNPRLDEWSKHFRLDRGHLMPLTDVGRATSMLLEFNRPEREETRRNLWLTGRYLPST